MNRLTVDQKKEALQNSLAHYNFPVKYKIVLSDARMGQKFAIGSDTENGGLNTHTNYMNYDEFNAFLQGHNAAKQNKF